MMRGVFFRRKSRRLAEAEVDGQIIEAYISNGIDIGFLKNGATCFLREAESTNRRTSFDLYSVYDQDTLVCVDAKEPLRIAEKWCSEKCNNEGKQVSFYVDVKGMTLLAMNRKNHDIVIQVMGTSFVDNRVAYLPEIPSTALNERLMSLLWMKEHGQNPQLCRTQLHGSRLQLIIDGSAPLLHNACNRKHELTADLPRLRESFRADHGLVEQNLHDAGPVSQIHKDQGAEISPLLRPAHQRDCASNHFLRNFGASAGTLQSHHRFCHQSNSLS